MTEQEKVAMIMHNDNIANGKKLDSISAGLKKQKASNVTVEPKIEVNVPANVPMQFPISLNLPGLAEYIEKLKTPKIDIPEIKLPEFPPFPEFKIPKIVVPKAEVIVKIPEIKVPTPQVTVQPTPVIFPDEMKVKGLKEGFKALIENQPERYSIREEVDSKNPLPVYLTNKNLGGGDMIAPTIVGLKNAATPNAQINPATEEKQDDIITALGNISIDADTINLNTDTLESLIGTSNTSLDTIAGTVSGGHLQVDVLTMPSTTVTATDLDIRALVNTDVITAELSATDNAVLDVIAGDTTSIDGKITACNTGAVVIASGTVTAVTGITNALPAGTNALGKLLPPDIDVTAHTNYIRKYYTSAGAATDGIIWSPAAGKRWHVVTMYIQISAAATITLEDDKAGGDDPVFKGEYAANSGVVLQFPEKYPMASEEDAADLTITTSAGNVYVTCVGYEI